MTPQRIQLRRTKGWRKPEGAVVVSRPTKWGNPYRWTEYPKYPPAHYPDGELRDADDMRRIPDSMLRSWAVNDFRAALDPEYGFHPSQYPNRDTIRRELGGRDLACWCPPNEPCHADVLLEIANEPASVTKPTEYEETQP